MNTTLRIDYRTLAIDNVQTREQWLNNLAQRMAPLYASLGAGLPTVPDRRPGALAG